MKVPLKGPFEKNLIEKSHHKISSIDSAFRKIVLLSSSLRVKLRMKLNTSVFGAERHLTPCIEPAKVLQRQLSLQCFNHFKKDLSH